MAKIIIESFTLSEGGEDNFLVRKDGGVRKIGFGNQKKPPPWSKESNDKEEAETGRAKASMSSVKGK